MKCRPYRITLLMAFVCAASSRASGGLPPITSSTLATTVSVTIIGGHATDPRDRGRPVILIASALCVPAQVFRDVFRGVHPAGPGSGGPTRAEAQANKRVLLDGLSKYGVTNERLDEVSNYYRYPPGSRSLWRNKPAKAVATVANGYVYKIRLVDPGAGYTSLPAISVAGCPNSKFAAKLKFGTDFSTNGSLGEIRVINPN